MDTFIDIGHYQKFKHNQLVGGDVFMSQKIDGDERVVSVLSDGLGSGIKASVLATLTSVMSTRFVAYNKDIRTSANLIMQTLPVCSERQISYSTFTIVDVDLLNNLKVIEYGNPSCVVLRGSKIYSDPKEREQILIEGKNDRIVESIIYDFQHGDRVIFFSDGVTQAGMGSLQTPIGWGKESVEAFIQELVLNNSEITSRELAREIVEKAKVLDFQKPKDDITCAVIHLRKPRKTLVASGPPIHKEKDKELSEKIDKFSGKKIICGGTTANIVSRELDRRIKVNLKNIDPELPPPSSMDGITLVTEGILTLCKTQEILEKGNQIEDERDHAAKKIIEVLLESDEIFFLIGTKINDVHQDPNIPVEIEIRRNIIKKIRDMLESKYMKKVHLEYI